MYRTESAIVLSLAFLHGIFQPKIKVPLQNVLSMQNYVMHCTCFFSGGWKYWHQSTSKVLFTQHFRKDQQYTSNFPTDLRIHCSLYSHGVKGWIVSFLTFDEIKRSHLGLNKKLFYVHFLTFYMRSEKIYHLLITCNSSKSIWSGMI